MPSVIAASRISSPKYPSSPSTHFYLQRHRPRYSGRFDNMVMMMLDLGTTIAVWGTALAIIPFLDVIIDWFCIGVPALRSPATRMRVLHDSLNSTRALLEKNKRELEAVYLGPDFDLPSKWDGIQTAANKLEVLVKGGGWKRYSVAHLLCCTRTVIRLNDRLNSVTKDLVTFNKKVFTALDTSLDPPSECPETAAAWLARRLRSLFNVPRVQCQGALQLPPPLETETAKDSFQGMIRNRLHVQQVQVTTLPKDATRKISRIEVLLYVMISGIIEESEENVCWICLYQYCRQVRPPAFLQVIAAQVTQYHV
ncbi:hypothetical protein VTO73DRAFT_12096 [Trametes versicolor]